MPALTRLRNPDALQETWLIYYSDMQAGTIRRSVGNPNAAPQWAMVLQLLSGICAWGMQEGTEATFDKASSDFARCFGICSANSRSRPAGS